MQKTIKKLLNQIIDFYDITPHQDIIIWAEETVDLSGDIGAERSRVDFSLTPHLVAPLKEWEFFGEIKEVTVMGIEQHGKTLLEIVGVLYNMIFNPCYMLCIYPSLYLAEEVNSDKYDPLLRRIPELSREIKRPGSRRKDCYRFSNCRMYFQGAGSAVMSKTCKVVVADEQDKYPVIHSLNNIEEMRKRVRTLSESIFFKVCTPQEAAEPGNIAHEFERSSRGYWTLRCKGCGELTMRSCDFSSNHLGKGGLQFETAFDEVEKEYYVLPDSIRLNCPVCEYSHVEADKFEMNQQGDYVHERPDRLKTHPGYQFGALCSLFAYISWERIANQILESGRRANVDAHRQLDNSWRGLPYSTRIITDEELRSLKSHINDEELKPEEIEFVFMVSDTQDSFNPTGIFAYDIYESIHLLDYRDVKYMTLLPEERELINEDNKRKNLPPAQTLEDLLKEEFYGFKPLIHVVDSQGHRTDEVYSYAKANPQALLYKGGSLEHGMYRVSRSSQRLVLVSARDYQAKLIFYLYDQKDRGNNYLFFPDSLTEGNYKEISAMRPDKKRRSGHKYENWSPGEDSHDVFDVLKMAYFAVDFAVAEIGLHRFAQCKAVPLKRRRARLEKRKEQTSQSMPKKKANSWLLR